MIKGRTYSHWEFVPTALYNESHLKRHSLQSKLVYINYDECDTPRIKADKLAIVIDTFEEVFDTGRVWVYWIKSDMNIYIEWEDY